ncbi:hypothetical protein AAHA92_33839 [Salvia divinorum]|uniref:Uncharacterized protein n=1 Tax=Salvia divinorum TaxID=28513 RepID=A0ABD1FKD1_SALDI
MPSSLSSSVSVVIAARDVSLFSRRQTDRCRSEISHEGSPFQSTLSKPTTHFQLKIWSKFWSGEPALLPFLPFLWTSLVSSLSNPDSRDSTGEENTEE